MRGRILAVVLGALIPAISIGACGEREEREIFEVPAVDSGRAPDADGAASPMVDTASPADADAEPVDTGATSDAPVCVALDAGSGPRVAKPIARQTGCCGDPFELLTETPDAEIHYTLDGTCPSAASALYTKPLCLGGSSRLLAIALKDGLGPSDVLDQTFVGIDPFGCSMEEVPAPVFAPDAGTYGGAADIVITCSLQGAVVFYTLDGTTPVVTSSRYVAPLQIKTTTTIAAIAASPSHDNSVEVRATYTITDASADAGTMDAEAGP